jgi:hypothetical protein
MVPDWKREAHNGDLVHQKATPTWNLSIGGWHGEDLVPNVTWDKSIGYTNLMLVWTTTNFSRSNWPRSLNMKFVTTRPGISRKDTTSLRTSWWYHLRHKRH